MHDRPGPSFLAREPKGLTWVHRSPSGVWTAFGLPVKEETLLGLEDALKDFLYNHDIVSFEQLKLRLQDRDIVGRGSPCQRLTIWEHLGVSRDHEGDP